MELKDAKVGMRVAIHPATDLWMRGVRFADIVKVGRKLITVEAFGRRWTFLPSALEEVR